MTDQEDKNINKEDMHTNQDLETLVKQRVSAESANYPVQEKGKQELSSSFIKQCIDANELGDGILLATLLAGKYIYNSAAGEWMKWAGHHWARDTMESILAEVETIVSKLLNEISKINEKINWALKKQDSEQVQGLETLRKKYIKRIDRLRTDKGRNACVKFARTCREPFAIEGTEFDQNPWLLGCVNGVIDLRSGKFRDSVQTDYISLASPVEWKDYTCQAPIFKEWLNEIFDSDSELIEFIQRILGYSIIGTSNEHIMIFLYGIGRNGKSTLIDILNYIMGPLAGSIPSEMLLSSKFTKSASGPSPDIMALRGLRMAFASETDENSKFSTSKVKWLSSGDELVGRNPHDKYLVRFNPTHTLFLSTNFKPQASDDFAFWERMYLIDFKLSFVDRDPVAKNERRARKGIIGELKKEASGILAWLVRGCTAYQKEGLNPPKTVRDATKAYRKDEDLLGQFLEDRCEIGDGKREQSKNIYESFSQWYTENISEKSIPSHIKFSKMMARRFDKDTRSNTHFFLGIEIKKP